MTDTTKGVIDLTNEPELINTEEAARRLGVKPKSVLRYVEAGDLEAVPVMTGKRKVLRYTAEAIEAFAEKQRQRLREGSDEG